MLLPLISFCSCLLYIIFILYCYRKSTGYEQFLFYSKLMIYSLIVFLSVEGVLMILSLAIAVTSVR